MSFVSFLWNPHPDLAIDVSDAVRNKFQLPPEEMERIWPWLQIVTLAKRQTLDGKFKKQREKTPDSVYVDFVVFQWFSLVFVHRGRRFSRFCAPE